MRHRVCGRRDAEQRLADAKQFLEAAEILESPDVVATNAIHAAIAAADVLTCLQLGERSNSGNHSDAVNLLRRVDANLALTLKRALDRKNQASYESTDISSIDAARCLRWAKQLLDEAVARLP